MWKLKLKLKLKLIIYDFVLGFICKINIYEIDFDVN